MIRTPPLIGGLALVGFMLCAAQALGAEELRPALNTPLILNMLAVPMESPEAAFRESLRDGPAARPAGAWQALQDGSVRYGSATLSVIIKNPCPDGTHSPAVLPGRRRR